MRRYIFLLPFAYKVFMERNFLQLFYECIRRSLKITMTTFLVEFFHSFFINHSIHTCKCSFSYFTLFYVTK